MLLLQEEPNHDRRLGWLTLLNTFFAKSTKLIKEFALFPDSDESKLIRRQGARITADTDKVEIRALYVFGFIFELRTTCGVKMKPGKVLV
jgi:hypothetical protein